MVAQESVEVHVDHIPMKRLTNEAFHASNCESCTHYIRQQGQRVRFLTVGTEFETAGTEFEVLDNRDKFEVLDSKDRILQGQDVWFWTAETEFDFLDCRDRMCGSGQQGQNVWFWTAGTEFEVLDNRDRFEVLDSRNRIMPRRKKSTLNRRPPLLFTESPVSIQHHAVSPVLSAQYPQTAKSIPVDEYFDASWVSPQFRMQSEVSGRVTRSRHRSALGESTRQNVPKYRNKFKALHFIGDPSVEETEIENIDITEDDNSPQAKWPRGVDRKNQVLSSQQLLNIESGISVFHHHPVCVHDEDILQDLPQDPSTRDPASVLKRNNKILVVLSPINKTSEIESHQTSQEPVVSTPATPNHTGIDIVRELDVRNRLPRACKEVFYNTLQLLRTPTDKRTRSQPPRVLVEDTPESEYGISLRQKIKLRKKRLFELKSRR
ncbi:hypothetical protein ScPMuIL_015679 [Solemya velum]